MRFAFFLVALYWLTGVASAADTRWLGDKDLFFVFVGREVAGDYANGVSFTETYRKIGKAEYRDTKNTLEGTWTITQSTLCTHYAEGGGGCFRVSQQSLNCFEYWLLTDDGEFANKNWIARGWQAKYPPTCPR